MTRHALRAALAAGLLIASLGAAPGAAGQSDEGIFVDPDSPTEKEYALPIDRARAQADPARPRTERVRKGGPPAPLFGVGVVPDADPTSLPPTGGVDTTGKATSGRPTSRSDPGGGGELRASPPRLPRRAEVAQIAATARSSADGGVGEWVLVGGGGAVLLLAGAAAGTLMRRR